MKSQSSAIGRVLSQSLHLSSDETHQREKAEEAGRAAYRRKYWQGYAKKVKRIFGTVSLQEYDEAKARAEEAGRSIWGQVWAEACAYREGRTLATGDIANRQRELIIELRRIGNNLNQLARLGHIQNRKHGILKPCQDQITADTMQQLAQLEAAILKFDDGVTIKIHAQD